MTDSLNLARQEIETLRQQEQEAALASAETKQKVHEELLKQAEEMIRMRAERETLNNKGTNKLSSMFNYILSTQVKLFIFRSCSYGSGSFHCQGGNE